MIPFRINPSFDPDPNSTSENGIRHSVQELCGLAGVAPVSRNRREWNGNVRFEDENSTAIVSYAFLADEDNPGHLAMASRINKALEGACIAEGLVQAAGFCCDSFTILKNTFNDLNPEQGKSAQVEMCPNRVKACCEIACGSQASLPSGSCQTFRGYKPLRLSRYGSSSHSCQ